MTLVSVYTSHQKVVLEIDFSGHIWVRTGHPHTILCGLYRSAGLHHDHAQPNKQGFEDDTLACTAVWYVPSTNPFFRGLEANDLCYVVIHGVTVGSFPADFVHQDPFAHLSVSNPQDVHNHPELKRRVYSALAEGDEGELSISIPREVAVTPSGHRAQTGIVSEGAHRKTHGTRSANLWGMVAATPEPQTPGHMAQQPHSVTEYRQIEVTITYSLKNPADGVQFVLPSEAYPTVSIHHLLFPHPF